MIWLGTPPWGRWLAAAALIGSAFWFEARPLTMVDHPYAVEAISRGELIGQDSVAFRKVPAGLLPAVTLGERAARDIPVGMPVLPADVSSSTDGIPTGWWTLPADLPSGSQTGDRVMVVLLDTGEAVVGVVAAAPGGDPFAGPGGSVALPPDRAAVVAAAAADGRVAVLVGID